MFNFILLVASLFMVIMMTVMAFGRLDVDGARAERDVALVIAGFKAYDEAARILGYGPGNMPETLEEVELAAGMPRPILRDGGVWMLERDDHWDAGRIVICATFPYAPPPRDLVEKAFSPHAFLPNEECDTTLAGGGYALILDVRQ